MGSLLFSNTHKIKKIKEGVNICPGISFGFNHPATVIMLELLTEESSVRKVRALDIGVGSGILSIFLAKRGVRKIYSIDIDPYILKEAKRNIKNNIRKKRVINLLLKDISFLKKKFSLITANVPVNVHTLIADDVKRLLINQGVLFCGGLLEGQVEELLSLYSNFKQERLLERDGWFALKMKKISEK
ncbi:MAG: 50S ribosomal protein L11 methyltransferase [Proteobacteria bacterium]|nr:50S ribosomal protein L11 methyltransferase [Pseudomonadota bacterium]